MITGSHLRAAAALIVSFPMSSERTATRLEEAPDFGRSPFPRWRRRLDDLRPGGTDPGAPPQSLVRYRPPVDEVEQTRSGLGGKAQRRDAIYRRCLAAADASAALFAILLGVSLLGSDSLSPAALLAVPLALLASKVTGLYDRDELLLRKTTLDEVPALFSVATLFAFVVYLAGDLILDGRLGRDQALAVWILLFGLMFFSRVLARRVALHLSPEERCLVIGDSLTTRFIADKLEQGPGLNASVVGRVPMGREVAETNGTPVVGDVSSLAETLEREAIERVIIAADAAGTDEVLALTRQVKHLGVKVSVSPRLFEVVGSSVEFDEVDGATVLGVRRFGLTRSSRALKRGLDLAGAGIGLVLLAPLFAVVMAAIKWDSDGPVFFRQRRVGRDDKAFEILKFRTMVDGADEQKAQLADQNEAGGGLFKIEDDPRTTRVGRLLRATSLDELPQLINVLRGEMALVGPRPLVTDEDQLIEGWQRQRLSLTPGMTGPWQVFGSARIPLHEMVKIDYLYGANWSLWGDVKILLRTVPLVIGRRGL